MTFQVNHGEKSGVYWKIGVNLSDVNTAVKQLQKNGVSADPGMMYLFHNLRMLSVAFHVTCLQYEWLKVVQSRETEFYVQSPVNCKKVLKIGPFS